LSIPGSLRPGRKNVGATPRSPHLAGRFRSSLLADASAEMTVFVCGMDRGHRADGLEELAVVGGEERARGRRLEQLAGAPRPVPSAGRNRAAPDHVQWLRETHRGPAARRAGPHLAEAAQRKSRSIASGAIALRGVRSLLLQACVPARLHRWSHWNAPLPNVFGGHFRQDHVNVFMSCPQRALHRLR
jgi:hypothetical protein